MSATMTHEIRWMLRRDLTDVADIEYASFPEDAWERQDFVNILKQHNYIGMVATRNGFVDGYMVYHLEPDAIRLINFAVRPSMRRQGIGSLLINRLIEKLHAQRRKELLVMVRDDNLPMQLFLRKNGFLADCVMRSHYSDGADGYSFSFTETF